MNQPIRTDEMLNPETPNPFTVVDNLFKMVKSFWVMPTFLSCMGVINRLGNELMRTFLVALVIRLVARIF